MAKNKAVTTKPRTGGNEKLLFRCVGWKGGKWIPTNSSGFQRELDLDPKRGLKQRWCFPALGMEPDSSGRWHREVTVVSKEEHGMQWSRGLAHWVTLIMTLSYGNPLWAQGLLYPSEKPSVLSGEPWSSCSVLPREASPGVALAKTTRGKEGGLAVEERLSRNFSMCFAHCTGNYVQDNNQLKLGFVHMKPTADPI